MREIEQLYQELQATPASESLWMRFFQLWERYSFHPDDRVVFLISRLRQVIKGLQSQDPTPKGKK